MFIIWQLRTPAFSIFTGSVLGNSKSLNYPTDMRINRQPPAIPMRRFLTTSLSFFQHRGGLPDHAFRKGPLLRIQAIFGPSLQFLALDL